MVSEPKTKLLLKDSFLNLTLKLLKLGVFMLRIYGKGIQSHSNHSPQLLELKKKKQQIKSRYLNFLFDSNCNTQNFHTTGHTYARLIFMVTLVDNEFSSKYCCVYNYN